MPCCCTFWGRSGKASWSLFCTWTWAMFGSVPASNVRTMLAAPAESLDDDMYRRRSMPFIFCSTTCVTVSSTVFAEAPGYMALMAIWGGAIAGYWETGSLKMASPPASMMTMAMTHAKMGRSMKKRAMQLSFSVVPGQPRGAAEGRDGDTGGPGAPEGFAGDGTADGEFAEGGAATGEPAG